MIRLVSPGQVLLALGLAGLGTLSLFYRDFALQWQPVPPGLPGRAALALASGILLLACATGLIVKRAAPLAAGVLLAYLCLWVLLLHGPRVAAHPSNVGVWLGLCESLALAAGGWTLLALLGSARHRGLARRIAAHGVRGGRLLFALALLVFGLSHFVYADFTATLIPKWIPARVPLAYLTGTAHAAAGVALLCGVLPQLAATLEALMMSSFVILVHFSAVAARPHSREQWTALAVATALTGAAWLIAGALAAKSASRGRAER